MHHCAWILIRFSSSNNGKRQNYVKLVFARWTSSLHTHTYGCINKITYEWIAQNCCHEFVVHFLGWFFFFANRFPCFGLPFRTENSSTMKTYMQMILNSNDWRGNARRIYVKRVWLHVHRGMASHKSIPLRYKNTCIHQRKISKERENDEEKERIFFQIEGKKEQKKNLHTSFYISLWTSCWIHRLTLEQQKFFLIFLYVWMKSSKRRKNCKYTHTNTNT